MDVGKRLPHRHHKWRGAERWRIHMKHECKITVLETKCFPELQEKYMEQREHKVVNYSFRPEQNLSMVAE